MKITHMKIARRALAVFFLWFTSLFPFLFGVHPLARGGKLPQRKERVALLELRQWVPQSAPAGPFSFLRIDSPLSASLWALWTKRSRMASARVGSPIVSCQ